MEHNHVSPTCCCPPACVMYDCLCRMSDLMYKITSLKFQDPTDGEEALKSHFGIVDNEITERFRALEEEFR